jgi:hypothetical protein
MPTDTTETMKLTDDPPMAIDPTLPEVASAMAQIRAQVDLLRREEPDWTERQILQEARRRCTPALLAAIEAAEQRAPKCRVLCGADRLNRVVQADCP